MNYIKQLTHFFTLATADPNLSPTHISLFVALFQQWNQSRFAPSIQIVRDDIMRLAKISSKATYHRSMAYLHRENYIKYKPSYNPYKGSLIEFFPPQPTDTHNIQQRSQNEPVQNMTTRLINEPFNKLYNTNIINHNISIARDKKEGQSQKINSQVKISKKEKSCGKKESEIPPQIFLVEEYFIQNNSTHQEAQRFINHYTANGWLVGGKTPMKDWQASARNWMTNAKTFNNRNHEVTNNRAKQLNTKTNKNYFEPL